MQHIKINCNDLLSAINATIAQVKVVENVQPPPAKNTTMSDTDPIGAVKFTVAVVLLYGVGVIGLLGITARRNRRVELMDKEVNKFLKNQFGRQSFKRKPKPKTAISKLISSIHTPSKSEESQSNSRVQNKLIQKCSTWSGGMDSVIDDRPSLGVTTKTVSMSLLDPSRPCNITGYSLVPTNEGPLLPGNAQTPREYRVPLFYQELHSDNLETIDEENDEEFSKNRENDSDTDLKEVRVVIPEEEMRIRKGFELNTSNVTNKQLRNDVVQTSLPSAMISEDTAECSSNTREDTTLDTTERNIIHNNTPSCGQGVDFINDKKISSI